MQLKLRERYAPSRENLYKNEEEREFIRSIRSPDVSRRSPTKTRAKFKDEFKTLIEQAENEFDSDSDEEVNMKNDNTTLRSCSFGVMAKFRYSKYHAQCRKGASFCTSVSSRLKEFWPLKKGFLPFIENLPPQSRLIIKDSTALPEH